jgi:hypothetical protein
VTFILDACALIAFLNDEEGADIVENLLDRSVSGEDTISMSIVNLLEIYSGGQTCTVNPGNAINADGSPARWQGSGCYSACRTRLRKRRVRSSRGF